MEQASGIDGAPSGGEVARNEHARLLTDGDARLVSVIVRTVGRPELAEALASIAAQRYPAIEVVVVDAAGGDAIALGDCCGRFPLRLCGGQKLARSAAANAGLAAARGELIIFLDEDDLFLGNHVQALAAALRRETDARVAYAGVRALEDGRPGPMLFNRPFDPDELLLANYIPIHAALFERSLLETGARFDESLEVFEDWDFWLQIARHTRFVHVDQVSAFYRAGGGSGIGLEFDEGRRAAARTRVLDKWAHALTPARVNAAFERRLAEHHEANEAVIERLRRAEAEAAFYRQRFDWVVTSRSWRVTRPLRNLIALLRGGDGPAPEGPERPPELVPEPPGPRMAGPPPSVSVILPVYNACRTDPQLLDDAIDSVRAQTVRPTELIIVDDGSTDGTAARCLAALERVWELPVRFFQKPNGGQSSARNYAAERASGEWLAFVDQDDRWKPARLETVLPWASCGQYDVVYTDADLSGELDWRSIHRERRMGWPHPKRSLEDVLYHDIFVMPGVTIVRRELFLAVGGFDEALSGYEDDDLFLRLYQNGRVGYVPRSTLVWRIHEEGYSQSDRMVRSRERYWRKLVAEHADGGRNVERRVRISRRFFWQFLTQAARHLYYGNPLEKANLDGAHKAVGLLSLRERLLARLFLFPGLALVRLVPAGRKKYLDAVDRWGRPWM